MSEIDSSIYSRLGQNNDPLKQPLAIMQLLGAVNQNKLFQQTYDARQNIGEAYKRNVDSAGKIDNRGLVRDIAGTGGFLAGEATGTAGANATQQFSLDTAKLQKAQSIIGSLASKKDLSTSDFASAAAALKRAGVDQDVIDSIINPAYKVGDDPKALKKIAANHGIMSLGTGALEGEAGPISEGQPTTINKGEAIERRAGVVPGQNGTGMEVVAPAGYSEAAGRGAALLGDARSRAANYGSDVFPMTNLLSNLEKLGPQGTGPGTHEINTMKSFVQSNLGWLPGADKIIGDPNKIKDYNEAEKYATQLAGSRASQFGHGTDQAMAQSLIGSPNTHISNLAGVDLTKAIIGLRRMEHVQTLEADNDPAIAKNPAKFGTWAARWATNVDPRAFMVDLMDKDQLANLQKSIRSPADKAKFNRSVKMAIDNGIITNPAGEHAPGQ